MQKHRTHIVMVPGFVGFDALGQLGYYAGLTQLFHGWKHSRALAPPEVALHYFDNFPTASVETRARRLRSYLAKRFARGEFEGDDRIVLVGHSTGGLDIRKLLFDLGERPLDRTLCDGATWVSHGKLLELIDRVVFLSVPHFGTNLADFAYQLKSTTEVLLRNASWAITLNRNPIAFARRLLVDMLPETKSGLLVAVADALNESDEHAGDTYEKAHEREARTEFALWLEHMGRDFGIVKDLLSHPTAPAGSTSPAHFTPKQRADEINTYRTHDIKTRSYATHVPRNGSGNGGLAKLLPLVKVGIDGLDKASMVVNGGANLWWALPPPVTLGFQLLRAAAPALSAPLILPVYARPQVLFQLAQGICADPSGPFTHPDQVAPDSIAPTVNDFVTGAAIPSNTLQVADNDGVVNTLSMLWPYDPARPKDHPIHLLRADHADTIGHYELKRHPDLNGGNGRECGREHYAYDFFDSGAPFGMNEFRAIWEDVFEFCAN